MVRLADLPEYERQHLLAKNLPALTPAAWTAPSKPLSDMRFALLTTAGLHYRDAENFAFADASYRPLQIADDSRELVMSHSSVNFDRAGFVEDVNVVFPYDRFRELVDAGTIGGLSEVHYSFMGAGLLPQMYAQSAAEVAGLLKQEAVDAVFLTPV
ncbi:MAG: glycine/sarcosine/betaine reductase selenoprotein B family protein [Pseudomonadota bacterium]